MLKIDLAKDRLEWNFITNAMHSLGFADSFINLTQACFSSPQFSVLVNNTPGPFFQSQRGLDRVVLYHPTASHGTTTTFWYISWSRLRSHSLCTFCGWSHYSW